MNLEEFLNKWNNRYTGGTNQCVELISKYREEVLGTPSFGIQLAKDIYNKAQDEFYDKIPNTPENIPQRGDIIVFNGNIASGVGHTDIATGEGDVHWFNSFSENWPIGSPCHYVRHNYNNVIGWLHFKNNATNDTSNTGGNMLGLDYIKDHLWKYKDNSEVNISVDNPNIFENDWSKVAERQIPPTPELVAEITRLEGVDTELSGQLKTANIALAQTTKDKDDFQTQLGMAKKENVNLNTTIDDLKTQIVLLQKQLHPPVGYIGNTTVVPNKGWWDRLLDWIANLGKKK